MSTTQIDDDFNSLKSILPHWDPTVLASIFQANEYSLELSIQTALSMEEEEGKPTTTLDTSVVELPSSSSDKVADDKEPSSTISSTSPSSTTVTPVKIAILDGNDQKSDSNSNSNSSKNVVDNGAGQNRSNKNNYRGAKFELPDEFLRVSN